MFINVDLHYIEKDIILSLAGGATLRFSQLQPKEIPNNVFSYHLKKLVELGYVEHSKDGYYATRKGLKSVLYSGSKIKQKAAPPLISIVYVTNDDGKVLLLKRRNKPFAGWFGLPSGLIHQGESLDAAAKRELFEKTGIVSDKNLEFVGVLDFRYLNKESNDLFVHAVAFVYKYKCICQNENDVILDKESKYGELDWSGLTREKILPEVRTITEMVNKNSPSIKSVNFEEPV